MLNFAWIIAQKDLKLVLARGCGLAQAMLLGLLLIFVFSLSLSPGRVVDPGEAATIFWLASAFCQILVFNQLYALEEANGAKQALILAPQRVQGIWLGKGLAAFILLLLAQIIFMPSVIIFLGQNIASGIYEALGIIFLADIGICALGSLLGAIGQGQGNRESLLSIIFFPLLIPLLLGGISVLGHCFGSENQSVSSWLGMAAAFDSIFIGSGLILFGFLYQGDD